MKMEKISFYGDGQAKVYTIQAKVSDGVWKSIWTRPESMESLDMLRQQIKVSHNSKFHVSSIG